jgi:hypothetical protein
MGENLSMGVRRLTARSPRFENKLIARLSWVSDTIEFRVGTASWTDPTLINSDLFIRRPFEYLDESSCLRNLG